MLHDALVQEIGVNLVNCQVKGLGTNKLDVLANDSCKAEYMIIPVEV
jgi:hypothetical protein